MRVAHPNSVSDIAASNGTTNSDASGHSDNTGSSTAALEFERQFAAPFSPMHSLHHLPRFSFANVYPYMRNSLPMSVGTNFPMQSLSTLPQAMSQHTSGLRHAGMTSFPAVSPSSTTAGTPSASMSSSALSTNPASVVPMGQPAFHHAYVDLTSTHYRPGSNFPGSRPSSGNSSVRERARARFSESNMASPVADSAATPTAATTVSGRSSAIISGSVIGPNGVPLRRASTLSPSRARQEMIASAAAAAASIASGTMDAFTSRALGMPSTNGRSTAGLRASNTGATSGPGTVNPSIHPQFRSKAVCKIFCRHCSSFMCNRGMRAILLGNTEIELFSTDVPPSGVQLVYQDYATHNCACQIRDAACLGCGNIVGYHVTQPCERCLEACNNGHFWMFLSDGVSATERFDAASNMVLRWATIPSNTADKNCAGDAPNDTICR